MEPLEISKIEIQSLYHKGDVVIDFEKDCTILIGENGIGKTSALKITQSLITGDMISVGNYIFDKIIITDSEMEHVFSQQDFLIPIQRIEDIFDYYCLQKAGEDEIEYLSSHFKMLLSELEERDLLGRFLSETYRNTGYSSLINTLIEKHFSSNILSHMNIEVDDIYPCYDDSPICSSTYYKNIIEDKYWMNGVVFGDMVEKIRFPEKEDGFVHFKLDSSNERDLIKAISDNEKLEVHMSFDDLEDGSQTEERFTFDFEEEFRKDILVTLIKTQNMRKVVDIHSAIRAIYFSDDVIQELNDAAIRGTKLFLTYINENKEYSEQQAKKLIDMVGKELLYVHQNYIFPLLAEELPFRIHLTQLINRINWGVQKNRKEAYKKECALLESYLEVYDELKEIVLDTEMVADSIRSFQDLITQYIDDKVICVTPRGLNVYLKRESSFGYTSETYDDWVSEAMQEEEMIFGDSDTEMSANSLSSGECKIIMLAFYATFADRAVLIMDEPELSISILWQQNLMRDLLDYGRFKSIIVATHSPYIARDDSLEAYIHYLP